MSSDSFTPDLEDALAAYIGRVDDGDAPEAEAFAASYPEIRDELLRAIAVFVDADTALPDIRDALPSRIDSWHVHGFVGQGAFGRVLRVRRQEASPDEADGALKLVHEGLAMHPRALERFRRECAALRQVDHPGIAAFRDHGVFGNSPYIVTDLITGPSFADVIDRARQEARESRESSGRREDVIRQAKWIAKLARSVHELHACGLLHRDLKPANVILDEANDSPILIDLGLVGGEAVATLTNSGDILGTPAYMAPEQARGEACTEQSDVYGLGGILYEMLTLTPPRSGRSSGSAAEEMRVRRERRPRSIDPRIPKALAAICERALAFAPRWRHASALALAEDLEHFVETGRAKAPSRRSVAQLAHEAWVFHRTALVALASAVLVCGVFLAIYLGEQARKDTARTERRSLRLELERAVDARRRVGERRARVAPWPEGLEIEADLRAVARDILAGRRDRCIEGASRIVYGPPQPGADPEHAEWTRGMAALLGGIASLERKGTAREHDALKLLLTARRALPDSKLALREVMRAHRLNRRWKEARATSALLAKRDDLEARDWHEIAKLACEVTDVAVAEQAIRELERSEEGMSVAMLNTAAVFASQRGDMKAAHSYYARIKELDPGYALARLNEAHSLDKDCRLREARDAYIATIALEPSNGQAIASLAWLHAGSGRPTCEKCVAEFERHPELADPDRALALCMQAIEATRGRSSSVLASVVATAKRLGQRAALAARLRKLQSTPGLSDRRLSRVTRAIQELER